MGFVIANYFYVSDLSVFWDVCKFDEETCVGARNFKNALKKVPDFAAKYSFPKWLQTRVFHKGHVFNFFSGDGVNDFIGLVLMVPMSISQGDCHVGSVHAAEVVLEQVSGERFSERLGTPGGAGGLVIGVTTLGSNDASVMSWA
jgi:hypothetical protein